MNQFSIIIIDHFAEPEKNFALESYGEGSKCFDHSESMWEERSCHQTREWQHWGSGCYKYNCVDGRLYILVGNYSYKCSFPGQKLSIRITANGWLHKGAIMCPTCHELCGAHFAAQGTKCRPGEEPDPLNLYPRDNLTCGAHSQRRSVAIISSALLLAMLGYARFS